MELSLESALSLKGMLGHSAYLLLVLSMAMHRMISLRLLVLASAFAGLCYSAFVLNDPVGTFWESLLIAVNLSHMALMGILDRRAIFTAEEAALADAALPGLTPALRRKVIRAGNWRNCRAGDVLSTQDVKAAQLHWLLNGQARVSCDGAQIAICGAGSLIGELTALGGEKASAGVTLETPARIWSIEAEALGRLAHRHVAVAAALEQGFALDIRRKLRAANLLVMQMTSQVRRAARPRAGRAARPSSSGPQKPLPARFS